MYMPIQNEETCIPVMQALIQAHPLGPWVSAGEGELIANHIPFEIDPARGELGTLVGHVARANPVWRQPRTAVGYLVAFQALPWSVADAPADYLDRMLGAIVGVEIPIVKLTGKWKMSQNRSEADQLGVVAGLLAKPDPLATAVADIMRKNLESS